MSLSGGETRQRRHCHQDAESHHGGVPARQTPHIHMTIICAESGGGAASQRDLRQDCGLQAPYHHQDEPGTAGRFPMNRASVKPRAVG